MIWFVGKVSKEAREYCEAQGIAYGRFTTRQHLADGKTVVYVNMQSEQTVTESLRLVSDSLEVDGVAVSGYEHYVLPAAWIAHHFKVPGPTPAAALAATDKAVMRQAFISYDPSISPAYALVESWEDIEQFVRTHGLPVMLKPANLMKSLFITKNHSMDELRQNYQEMQSALPDAYGRYGLGEPRIIVEECMTGSMHTVAGFVNAAGELTVLDDVVDCVMAGDIGKHDSYLFARRLPSTLSTTDADAVKAVARKGVTALGLTSISVHAELMLTDSGPKIIEIGARIGGYRTRMYNFARGLDLYAAMLAVSTGQQIDLQPNASRACTVLELFADAEGTFAGITNEEGLRHLPSYTYSHITVGAGETTGRASAGFRAPLIIMLGHDSAAQVAADTAWVLEHVSVQLDA